MLKKIEQMLDSREVAEMVGKDHDKLLKDIRRYIGQLGVANIGDTEFFKESIYRTTQNKEMPCYLVTKKGCEFIAHKLTGVKGTEFTAKYINRFHEMEDVIEQGTSQSNQISFKEQVECVGIVADMLHVNDASKILMVEQLYKDYNLPTTFLPKYEHNGSRELKSATELLKHFELGMNARNFNILLKSNGYLEEKTRPSTSSKTGEKKFNALTEKGLQYGENVMSPRNQREVQPLYYIDTFEELFNLVINAEVA